MSVEGLDTPVEKGLLREIFDVFDPNGTGCIDVGHIPAVLERLGRDVTEDILNELDERATQCGNDGKSLGFSFSDFVNFIQTTDVYQDQNGGNANGDNSLPGDLSEIGPDPKVMEFITILDEYRVKCEDEGNYIEAQRANTQLKLLRKQELKRQSKSLRAKQISERQDIQVAHNMQFNDFNQAWDQYMEEYDRMAAAYVKQLNEKHATDLEEFQAKLKKEVMERPPKFSKELIEWRRRQRRLAQQKNYAEAQKIKKVADEMEEDERAKMNEDYIGIFARKEGKFRQQQQAELGALLKRIDGRRKEHLKQRALDSKRLLQRNRNVQGVLESKQITEGMKKLAEMKTTLLPKESSRHRGVYNLIPPEARVINRKKQSVNLSEAMSTSPV